MAVNSRQDLIDYALRALGHPVIEINVDEQQLEDRVDEGLQYYQEFNQDATVRSYLKHQITQTDIDNGYITVGNEVLFVRRMLPLRATGGATESLFNMEYQMRMNDINNLFGSTGDFVYREQIKMHINMVDMKTAGYPTVTFNRLQNRLYIHGEFSDNSITVGDFIVIEVLELVSPDSYTEVYNDIYLKEYVIALIKRQWGANLIKFEGMVLPGGVTMNGRQLFDDANEDIARLREEARLTWERPIDFFIG
jgi:hypothetical protein